MAVSPMLAQSCAFVKTYSDLQARTAPRFIGSWSTSRSKGEILRRDRLHRRPTNANKPLHPR
jgi:hypothetical protein